MKIHRGICVAAVGLCLAGAAAAVLAKPGVVRTKEGQVYEGDVVDKDGDDFVTVTVRGISTQIARADVQSIADGQGIDDEYKQRLAKLDATDYKGRMDLARWAFAQHRYDLARDAADKALVVDPNSAEATQFLTLVQSQQRMERAKARAASEPTTRDADGAPIRGAQVEWKLLTAEDVNRVRQEELRRTDSRARFQFRNDVEKRFLASNRAHTLVEWRALSPLQRAILILDEGDPSLRTDVYVTTDPGSILEYRRLVQPVALATCATAACHGGSLGGRLVLNTTAETNEAATYTNFYILQRYSETVQAAAGDKQSVFGGSATYQMIDRTHPEDSLFLQYGLPRGVAKIPHPDVAAFRPAFNRGREDTKYQAIWRWIGQTLAPIEPNYGINYDPPTGASVMATRTAAGGGGGAAPSATTRPVRQR